ALWRGMVAAGTLVLAWSLGFLLAGPHLLPLVEYCSTGARMIERQKGSEERPPIGLDALPHVVLPWMYGTTRHGWVFLSKAGNLPESAAAAYTGMSATLLLAPLAWCSRRHRSINLFWLVLSFLALSWVLNIPGMVSLLRLPVLNMFSHNRF